MNHFGIVISTQATIEGVHSGTTEYIKRVFTPVLLGLFCKPPV